MGWSAIAWLGLGAVMGTIIQRLGRSAAVEIDRPQAPAAPAAALAPIGALTKAPTEASTEAPTEALAEQWQLAYYSATDMAQLKGGFLARTSHELRSPLNSVISLHQLILSDLCDSPEEEREFVAQSYEAAQKLLKLLDQLTDLSKLEHGGASLDITNIDLNVLLLEVEQVVQIQAQNRNLRLEIAHPEEDIEVKGDRQRLLQVLVHLLTAPITLMDNGYIWLRVQAQGDQVALQITDQRPVAAWAEPRQLLQADATPDPAPPAPGPTEPSPGLTLMLCQRLMALMGGELRLVEAIGNLPPSANPPADVQSAASASPQLECRLPRANQA